jgi:gamma-glutamylcyclotransferase (GGCT)/AIG2-like uncharacterized protein YtfP
MAAWEHIPYFAYGHNTNVQEMYRRVPNARLIGHADLHDWKYVLEHVSNIVPSEGDTVHGVLWIIPIEQLDKLDWAEAYHSNYRHQIVTIEYDGKMLKAMSYVLLKKYHSDEPPTAKYVDYVTTGYRENHIPMSQLITALDDRITELKHTQK